MTELKNNIIEKIEAGDVTMRPHWHFVLKATFYTTLILTVALVAVYILSFIFFALAKTGLLQVSGFGWGGLVFAITRSPWILILLVGMLLIILAVLVRDFAFSYKRPMLYSLIGIVFFILITSTILHTLAIHSRMQAFSERHNVPGLTPFYRDAVGMRPEGITPGRVEAIKEDGFVLRTPEREIFDVTISPQTRGLDGQAIETGDIVLVFGKKSGNTITALGIRPLREDMPLMEQRR